MVGPTTFSEELEEAWWGPPLFRERLFSMLGPSGLEATACLGFVNGASTGLSSSAYLGYLELLSFLGFSFLVGAIPGLLCWRRFSWSPLAEVARSP